MRSSPPPSDPAPGWSQSLYRGACGIALRHIAYAHSGVGHWTAVHEWAAATLRNPVNAHPDVCGLGQGAPAVAFTLRAAGHSGYTGALVQLDRQIDSVTRCRLKAAHERIASRRRPALREFDLIHGLTGMGAYLLHRGKDGEVLRAVLRYLVCLTEQLEAGDGQPLPGWWTDNGPNDRPSERWPGGHGNLGMAHGIAGPLALLSSAMRRGVCVAGQPDAIGRICDWLDRWRTGIGPHAWWPETISAVENRSGVISQPGPGRPSWCYGVPGLARAQQLAGRAIGDVKRQRLAEQALAGCLADDRQLVHLRDATLCHGWAGLLHTTWRVAGDAEDPAQFTLPRILAMLDRHLLRDGRPLGDALLDGATGVQLARHTVTTGVPPRSRWDACLLLDGGHT